jgi:hypothetical protein
MNAVGLLRALLLFLLAEFSATLPAADQPREFPLQVPLELEGAGPWFRLSVPMRVQLASRHADLRDLRVFNAAGETLAYSLVAARSQEEQTLETHEVHGFPLYAEASAGGIPRVDARVRRNADGTLMEMSAETQEVDPSVDRVRRGWVLDCSRIDRPLHRVVLDWVGLDGFQRFTIEASDDLDHWDSWGEGEVTRLRFGGEQIEQREVRLPDRRASYLRLLWKLPDQAPELREVLLQSSTIDRRPAPIVWTDALPARQIAEHAYVWELPLALPVERLRLPLQQGNLLVPVTLKSRLDPKQKWRLLSQGLFYRVTHQGKDLLQEELDLPGWSRFKELKLTIDPRGGGLGGQSPTLQFGVRGSELVFLARGEQPYTLAVGKPDAESAQLPLATLKPGLEDGDLEQLPQAGLAWTKANVTPPGPSPATHGMDWQRIGLWAVLLTGVGLLVLMAWSLLRSNKP